MTYGSYASRERAEPQGQQGRERGQLRQIAADGLARMYFRANNSRAHGLGVEFTDVEQLGIEL
ncbi:hypothetical protein [Streptomyces sp. NPDC048462]|uniref:hypothetical protein n=1 Tax=Streptomyces sp. NPDC048462 TaxID=3365555 RepID=UPI00371B688E